MAGGIMCLAGSSFISMRLTNRFSSSGNVSRACSTTALSQRTRSPGCHSCSYTFWGWTTCVNKRSRISLASTSGTPSMPVKVPGSMYKALRPVAGLVLTSGCFTSGVSRSRRYQSWLSSAFWAFAERAASLNVPLAPSTVLRNSPGNVSYAS